MSFISKAICSLSHHDDMAINFWGDDADYILFKCKRCGREAYYCSIESTMINRDENGIGDIVFNRILTDKEFRKEITAYNIARSLYFGGPKYRQASIPEIERIMKEKNFPVEKVLVVDPDDNLRKVPFNGPETLYKRLLEKELAETGNLDKYKKVNPKPSTEELARRRMRENLTDLLSEALANEDYLLANNLKEKIDNITIKF